MTEFVMEETEASEAYDISVKIRHPSWPARLLTEGLDCQPDIAWDVGEEHRTTAGTLLKRRDKTYWCVTHRVEGERRFSREFEQVCKWLSTKKAFLDEVQASG